MISRTDRTITVIKTTSVGMAAINTGTPNAVSVSCVKTTNPRRIESATRAQRTTPHMPRKKILCNFDCEPNEHREDHEHRHRAQDAPCIAIGQ
ncbi:MAG: hypothetical protein WA683_02200 [Pseudolabrys sp.]